MTSVAAGGDVALVPMPRLRKMIVTVILMTATMLVVLDQTIAVVALPHMQAALGATPDTINWVLTSYILAGALGTPLTGWLVGRFGRTRFLGIAVIGFTASSALCGLAVSLPMMVVARCVQGFFGAFLLPMSQAFLYDMNPPSQQVRAISTWGAGVTVAPMLGPLLGGYLTDWYSWRWVFFINVPVGLVAAAGIFALMPGFPSVRRSFDRIGFLLIGVALCSLQLALDRGTQEDWFESTEIVMEMGIAIAAFWVLIFYLQRARDPIIAPRLFRSRNYSAALILALVIMPVLSATSALIPPLTQILLGYSVQQAAMTLLPRAATLGIALVLGGQLIKYVDARVQIIVGILLIAWSLHLQTGFNLQMDDSLLIWSGVVQGLGIGLAMTVINYVAVSSVSTALRTEASAVYMLARNIGSSIGIALMSAFLARNIQINHAELGSALGGGDRALFQLAQNMGGMFASERIAAIADAEINRQAMMIAYNNDFWLLMWATLATIPLALVMRPSAKPTKDEPAAVME